MGPVSSGNLRRAQIADDHPGFRDAFPDNVYNRVTRSYYAPIPGPDMLPGVAEAHAQGLLGQGFRTAIIDTGLMLSHPTLQARLADSVDFTGEGPDDQNGHGTAVAFVLLATAPQTQLVNVKCFDQSGTSSSFDLIRGLKWCAGKNIRFVNLSAGVFRPECRGDCEVCEAARELGRTGPLIFAAAGNNPAEPLCPGKAAWNSTDIVAVGAYEVNQARQAPYSAAGEIYGDVGLWQYVEVK